MSRLETHLRDAARDGPKWIEQWDLAEMLCPAITAGSAGKAFGHFLEISREREAEALSMFLIWDALGRREEPEDLSTVADMYRAMRRGLADDAEGVS